MTPLFFGNAARRLFGLYESPAVVRPDASAVLLCYPWGTEYLYAHRAMRQLASMLAGNGHHVLRFDYHGTGDSSGEMTAESLTGWEGDVQTAIAELQALSGISKITVIGLRLGANLAARSAATLGDEIAGLVLWDPIADGVLYVEELFEACKVPHLKSGGAISRRNSAGGGFEVLGYPLTETLMRDIRRVNLANAVPALTQRTFVICSDGDEDFLRTREAMESAQLTSLTIEHRPGFPCWEEDWPINVAIIPIEVLSMIVEWVG